MTDKLISQDSEIWKPIPDYEGLYEVSNLGRIKSIPKKVKNSSGSFRFLPEKNKKIYTNRNGYKIVNLSKNNKSKTHTVHRLVAKAFIGDSDMHIDHINNIKTDNRLENLQYCTARENTIKSCMSSYDDRYLSFNKVSKQWVFSIHIKGIRKNIKYSKRKEDCIKSRDVFLKENPQYDIRDCFKLN